MLNSYFNWQFNCAKTISPAQEPRPLKAYRMHLITARLFAAYNSTQESIAQVKRGTRFKIVTKISSVKLKKKHFLRIRCRVLSLEA